MLGEPLGLELPGVSAILAVTAVTRSRAYELCREVLGFLPSLSRRVGRPSAAAEPARPLGDGEAVSRAVLGFLMTHPGSVHGQGKRQRYGDAFRRFVVRLRPEHEALSLEDFAACAAVPLGTLRSWLVVTSSETVAEPPEAEAAAPTGSANALGGSSNPSLTTAHIDAVLAAYTGGRRHERAHRH